MLSKIRERSQGWIAWVIVGLIIVTFALFGIEQYAQSERVVVVAEVNGEEVSGRDFIILYNRQQQRLRTQLGDLYDQIVQEDELRSKVLDSLIESTVIQQWFAQNNMFISDLELSAIIESADIFHKDGVFDKDTYMAILARSGLSPERYEYEQRLFLIENQHQQITQSSIFATDTQIKLLSKLQFQTRKLNYLRIDQHSLARNIEVTAEQIAEFYEENKQNYIIPKKVTVDYLLLSKENIAKSIMPTIEELEIFYRENQNQFIFPEQRGASHILILVEDPLLEADALAKINDIQLKIKAGEDFGKLAKVYSQDPGSAHLNGDLGVFQEGMMVAEFDKAVFSLELGQVSEPVRTDFGYHLIKLNKIEPKSVKAFKDVKEQVKSSFRDRQASRKYFDLLEQLSALTFEQPDTLDSASDVLEVAVATSLAFSRDGGADIITSNPKVIVAAFSQDVMVNKLNSALLELSPSSSVVIRINQIIPIKQRQLAEVTDEIKATIKQQAGLQASANLAQEILIKVSAGEPLKSFVKDGVEFEAKDWLTRESENIFPQLVDDLFRMPKPLHDKSNFIVSTFPTGDSVILELVAVKDGTVPESIEVAELLKATVNLIKSEAEITARINALVENAKVERKSIYQTIN